MLLQRLLTLTVVSMVTAALLVGGAEYLARRYYPMTLSNALNCLVQDPNTGTSGKPNCEVSQRTLETGLIRYHFNASGDRSTGERGVKPPGRYRVVLVGSSIAEGLRVDREQTLAALLPGILEKRTSRPVELYNEGIQWGTPRHIDLHFADVLAAHPDLILWILTKWDLENVKSIAPESGSSTRNTLFARLRETVLHSRSVMLAQHLLLSSETNYLRQYLKNSEASAYLRQNPGAEYEKHLADFGHYADAIAAKAIAARIPLVIALSPERAQALLIAQASWPAGIDPYRIGNRVRQAAECAGAAYIDTLSAYRTISDPGANFLPVDTHPNAAGHRALARIVGAQIPLTGKRVEALAVSDSRQPS